MFTITFCKRPVADAREVVVVQLQLLDLMIPKECGAVPMDAATRADLIDLMARALIDGVTGLAPEVKAAKRSRPSN